MHKTLRAFIPSLVKYASVVVAAKFGTDLDLTSSFFTEAAGVVLSLTTAAAISATQNAKTGYNLSSTSERALEAAGFDASDIEVIRSKLGSSTFDYGFRTSPRGCFVKSTANIYVIADQISMPNMSVTIYEGVLYVSTNKMRATAGAGSAGLL